MNSKNFIEINLDKEVHIISNNNKINFHNSIKDNGMIDYVNQYVEYIITQRCLIVKAHIN